MKRWLSAIAVMTFMLVSAHSARAHRKSSPSLSWVAATMRLRNLSQNSK